MKNRTKNMSVEEEKLEIIKWVTDLKDETALERLRMLRKSPKRDDWWTEIGDEEKQAIQKGIEDIKAGRVKPHKDAEKLYAKWL